jgi:hypothetical protein
MRRTERFAGVTPDEVRPGQAKAAAVGRHDAAPGRLAPRVGGRREPGSDRHPGGATSGSDEAEFGDADGGSAFIATRDGFAHERACSLGCQVWVWDWKAGGWLYIPNAADRVTQIRCFDPTEVGEARSSR